MTTPRQQPRRMPAQLGWATLPAWMLPALLLTALLSHAAWSEFWRIP